jgi:hypothetical protein
MVRSGIADGIPSFGEMAGGFVASGDAGALGHMEKCIVLGGGFFQPNVVALIRRNVLRKSFSQAW